MSEDYTDLENELRALRPRSLSAAALGRLIAAAPDHRPASRRAAWRQMAAGVLAAVACGVAAVLVFAAVRGRPTPPSPGGTVARAGAADGRLQAVAARNLLYYAADEGPVELAAGTRARQVRLRYVDTVTWRDPAGRSSLQWSVPRQEVIFVPEGAD